MFAAENRAHSTNLCVLYADVCVLGFVNSPEWFILKRLLVILKGRKTALFRFGLS